MKLPSNSVASSNLSTPIPAFFTPKLSFRHGNLPSNSNPNSLSFLKPLSLPLSLSLPPHRIHRFIPFCSSNSNSTQPEASGEFDSTMAGSSPVNEGDLGKQWNVEVRNPNFPRFLLCNKFSLSDQAFFLLSFIACTTSVAFISFVVAAVPTLYAMGRAATSLAKLADTAREELPSTMAAIRLSGMEISDLTLELSDLSQEISEGVSKSTQAVQAAEAGIRRIGTLARQQTLSMIEERANLPDISLQPVVTGAAKKTSRAVGHATRTLFNFFSGREESYLEDDEDY